jgi:hypothetical protein
MAVTDVRPQIVDALGGFQPKKSLPEAARNLFNALGYRSERDGRVLPIVTLEGFFAWLESAGRLAVLSDKDRAELHDALRGLHFLFQLTDREIDIGIGSGQGDLFDSGTAVDGSRIESYLVFAVDLAAGAPRTRTGLARLVRLLNKPLPMPALILFRQGDTLTLGVINRRLHKRDVAKDVLEKVTLIKDIQFADPLRAHIEILNDLSLGALHENFRFHNFVGLHAAWEKKLASYALNERFYREVANWYFWAIHHPAVKLPRSVQAIRDKEERDKQKAIFFIRLLTRLVFCWFLQEKRLVPRDLFRERVAKELLKDAAPKAGTFYRAFLQNLFFATLNQEQDSRGWRKKYKGSRDGNRGVTNLWRYQDLLTDPDRMEGLLRNDIPFVNGGLFDCLDDVRDDEKKPNLRLDDFSEEKDNNLCLPNELFFGAVREVDLSDEYHDKRRRAEKVRGLIEILSQYKFTVEENTPLEEEIALDPELLGKVFENLLASYDEDTRTTARKALGAFYTPREIVSYMVDEALRSYLAAQVASVGDEKLRLLFATDSTQYHVGEHFGKQEIAALINAIGTVKILDPACGSGAFPMGALHRLVDLLQKLDPNNEVWKRDRLADANKYYEQLRSTNAPKEVIAECEARIEDIKHSFDTRFHALDFARKLYLIENCIYGVDIQPIACQIAKLRFFIALVVDQGVDRKAPNLGVRPLPNLETKIVAADTLIPIENPTGQMNLFDMHVRPLRQELEQVRHDHFSARTPARKARCRVRDEELRLEIAEAIEQTGMPKLTADKLAAWDPYDQNHAATFFDSEWMFGIPIGKIRDEEGAERTFTGRFAFVNQTPGQMELVEARERESGFDVVIGNPPYVRLQTLKQKDPGLVAFYKKHYQSAKKGNYDLYVVFVEAGLKLLKSDGHLAYILPHKFFNAQYGEPLRGLIGVGRHLLHVVHFGDQQVFPGATNYVCLLFLAKAGVEACRFVRADDLPKWLQSFQGAEVECSAPTITHAEWNFAVGRDTDVFAHLQKSGRPLRDIAARISQGIRTSANEVYVLDVIEHHGSHVRSFSKHLQKEVDLEFDSVSQFLQGREIRPFLIQSSGKVVLMPYRILDGSAKLIREIDLRERWPMAHSYLRENKAYLSAREDGRFAGLTWFEFGRNQNVDLMLMPKILVPDIADHASFALDEAGEFAFTSGYGITLSETAGMPLKYILGLANSHVLDYYWRKVSTPLRGGYYRYFTQFIEQLPIVFASTKQETLMVRLVDYLLLLNRYLHHDSELKTSRDTLMLGYFEQLLNGLVYELYFPDELHAHNLRLFELVAKAELPAVKSIPEAKRLARLRTVFETIYDTNHPLRGALHMLRSLETVRIIEGEP